jgi:hypothetical protein
MKLVIAIVILAGTAVAKPKSPEPAPQQLIFGEDERVEGDVFRPDDLVVESVVRRKPIGLIRVREHFNRELVASADLL